MTHIWLDIYKPVADREILIRVRDVQWVSDTMKGQARDLKEMFAEMREAKQAGLVAVRRPPP